MRKGLSSFLSVAACGLALVACATNGGDDNTGDDGGGMRPDFTNGVSTLAGWSDPGYMDGDRQVNLFHNPVNVIVGPDGTVFVADFDNNKLRAVDAQGNATTVINMMNFQRPFGMVFGKDGTLYVSTDNDPQGKHGPMTGTVWKVDVSAKTATPVAVAVGRPRSLALLSDGRLAAADDIHHVIEIIDPRTGAVTPLAGTWDGMGMVDAAGPAAKFTQPYGIVQRSDGSLVVADFGNNRLRIVTLDGNVRTFGGSQAGFADGDMNAAMFRHPQAIAAASNGDLFVTDIDNFRVRKISGNTIQTVAGNGTDGYADSDDLSQAEFHGLEGLAVKPDGSMIYVADGTRGEEVQYNRVRQIKLH